MYPIEGSGSTGFGPSAVAINNIYQWRIVSCFTYAFYITIFPIFPRGPHEQKARESANESLNLKFQVNGLLSRENSLLNAFCSVSNKSSQSQINWHPLIVQRKNFSPYIRSESFLQEHQQKILTITGLQMIAFLKLILPSLNWWSRQLDNQQIKWWEIFKVNWNAYV